MRQRLAAALGRRIRVARYHRLQRRLASKQLLRAFAEAHPEAVFVEIGSNDGDQHDHLRPHILERAWSGIMVEPVPYVFERLRRNYGDLERVQLANVAIADEDGTVPFHHLVAPPDDLAAEKLPAWYDAIGSLSRAAVLSHADRFPDLENRLVTTDVPSLTYRTLLDRHRVEHVDLLLIDAEGLDWHILESIDLRAGPPRMLIYEHYHLSRADRARAGKHLRAHGYETMEEGFDTFCVRTEVDDQLTRTWRRTRPAVPGAAAYDE